MIDDPNRLLKSLNPDEKLEVAEYIAYRRKLAISGYRPVIAASKGANPKIIPSGSESLSDFVKELLKPDMLITDKQKDPLLVAKLKGIETMKQMLQLEGEPWTSKQTANYLKVSLTAISKQRRQGKILGLKLGAKGYVFPSWQFQSGQVMPGVAKTIAILEQNLVPDWDKLRFFVTGDYQLNGKTPIEYLRLGQIELVTKSAKSYGIQNAS